MEIITEETPLGGMKYPFFADIEKWTLVIQDIGDEEKYEPFGAKKTVSWITDGKTSTLYSKWTWEQFRDFYGLKASMHKGIRPLSKRMSRVFRPMFVWSFIESNDIKIVVDAELDEKTWDGAGLVSRKMLKSMANRPEFKELPYNKYQQLREQLRTAKRVEFTVLNSTGEMKGHALVVEDAEWDLYLPNDVKTEFSMNNGLTFVSFDFPHANDRMMIDPQSLINLGQFIPVDLYGQWLDEHNDEYIEAMMSGKAQADIALAYNPENPWWLAEFLYSGGQSDWFAGTTRAVAKQHSDNVYKKAMAT